MKKTWDYLNCEKMVLDSEFVEEMIAIAKKFDYELKCFKRNPCRFELNETISYQPHIYANHTILHNVIAFEGLSISFEGYGTVYEYEEEKIFNGIDKAKGCKNALYECINKHKDKYMFE